MRTLNESTTRLPDPVIIGSDYSRHPIPGQLALFHVGPNLDNVSGADWIRAILDLHGPGPEGNR